MTLVLLAACGEGWHAEGGSGTQGASAEVDDGADILGSTQADADAGADAVSGRATAGSSLGTATGGSRSDKATGQTGSGTSGGESVESSAPSP